MSAQAEQGRVEPDPVRPVEQDGAEHEAVAEDERGDVALGGAEMQIGVDEECDEGEVARGEKQGVCGAVEHQARDHQPGHDHVAEELGPQGPEIGVDRVQRVGDEHAGQLVLHPADDRAEVAEEFRVREVVLQAELGDQRSQDEGRQRHLHHQGGGDAQDAEGHEHPDRFGADGAAGDQEAAEGEEDGHDGDEERPQGPILPHEQIVAETNAGGVPQHQGQRKADADQIESRPGAAVLGQDRTDSRTGIQ